jgi:G patch domain-containing protein 1
VSSVASSYSVVLIPSHSSIGSALTSLIQPASSSVGQKLLMKMGWRPGQGIGPRVSARKRKIQEAKLLGRRTRPDAAELDVDGEEGKHLFAPRDSKLMVFEQKSGKEGLGYVKGQGMQGLGKGSNAEKAATNVSGTWSPIGT